MKTICNLLFKIYPFRSMFLLRNQYKATLLLMVVIMVILGLSSPITSPADAILWITGMVAICALSYFTRKQERKHFIYEEARIVEIEPKWGGTDSTLATLETISGVRLYQRYESKIAAPLLNTKL